MARAKLRASSDIPAQALEVFTSRVLAEEDKRNIRIGFLIHDVSRMRKRACDEFMKPLGVTRSQWWIVANLSRHDGIVQSELANVLDVGKASLGMVLDRLEESGLISRRPHPIDRRAKCVFLTKKAQQLVGKMLIVERSYDDIILKQLTSDDRQELLRLLEMIKRSLRGIESKHK